MSGLEANLQLPAGARPPQVVESGLKSKALLVAILALATIYVNELNSWIGAALAVPDLPSREESYTWLLAIMPIMILFDARPARARHWWLMAAAAAFNTAAALGWWGVRAALLYLEPEYRLGLFTGMLLLMVGIICGSLAYVAIHRLAGAHSPWRVEEEPTAGGTDEGKSPAKETRA